MVWEERIWTHISFMWINHEWNEMCAMTCHIIKIGELKGMCANEVIWALYLFHRFRNNSMKVLFLWMVCWCQSTKQTKTPRKKKLKKSDKYDVQRQAKDITISPKIEWNYEMRRTRWMCEVRWYSRIWPMHAIGPSVIRVYVESITTMIVSINLLTFDRCSGRLQTPTINREQPHIEYTWIDWNSSIEHFPSSIVLKLSGLINRKTQNWMATPTKTSKN